MVKSDIYKLIKTCVIIVVVVVVVDLSLGLVMSLYSERRGLPGDYTKIEYLFREAQDDVVIVGSSVAINSFMTEMMSDSLELSFFNGGCNAQNIIFFRCLIDGMLKRHSPEGIILVLQPEDLSEEYVGRIQLLNPYYGRSEVIDAALALQNDSKSTIFLHSNLYKYNTVWFRIFLQSLLPNEEMQDRGFVAKKKPQNLPVFINRGDDPDKKEIYEVKARCLEEILAQLKGHEIEVLVVFPPYYQMLENHGNPYSKQVTMEICERYRVPVIDHNLMPYFLERPELFYDDLHLNGEGAAMYTRMFLEQLKESEFYRNIKSEKDEMVEL